MITHDISTITAFHLLLRTTLYYSTADATAILAVCSSDAPT